MTPVTGEGAKGAQPYRESPRVVRTTSHNNNNNTHIGEPQDVRDSHSAAKRALAPLPHTPLVFRVAGHPVSQGSKRAFVVAGKARLVEAGGGRHKLWRHAVNDVARQAWGEHPPLDGPVELHLRFALQPPQSKPKRRRTWPVGARSGDLDKLTRAVFDALCGVAYLNDAQVVAVLAVKDWANPEIGPGVWISIRIASDQ